MQHLEVSIVSFKFIFRWESGKEGNLNKNLPKDKQYLVTKGVPCEKRIKQLKKFHEDNAGDLEVDLDDGWVETKNPEKKNNAEDQ